MNLIDEIFRQLRASKAKDSPEILALLATIKTAQPESHAIAVQIVENWQSAPSRSEPGPWMSVLTNPTTLMGGGLGIAGIFSLPWIQPVLGWIQQNVPLPVVQSPPLLLLIVGALGAIAGAGYSIYCHKGIVLPELGKPEGVLTLTRFGIVNEISFGAMAAVMTIWLAAVGLALPQANPVALPNPGAAANLPVAVPGAAAVVAAPIDKNLLSYSVVLGALVSGWMGARMRSSRLDQSLLKKALAKTSEMEPQSENRAKEILEAKSASAAATLATGMRVVGTSVASKTDAATVPDVMPGFPETLFQLLDETRVRAAAAKNGPLKNDGAWLTLAMLHSLAVVNPVIRQVLGDFKLMEIAAMPLEELNRRAKDVGIDVDQLGPLLVSLHSSTKEVAALLAQQPASWSWPA